MSCSGTGHAGPVVVSMEDSSLAMRRKRTAPVSDTNRMNQRQDEFERVAIPHTTGLLRVARRLCADSSTAEDLVQEALLLAWRGFHQFQAGTNIRAWLFKIMYNAYYARGRKLRSMPPPLELDSPDVTIELPVPATTSPVDRLAVNRAMAGLSEEHRSVLLLAVVEGLTCQETAEVLHVPIGTVMSRLSRARDALRDKLQPRPEIKNEIANRTACGAEDAR